MSVDWGTVPAWISAVATTIGVAWAIFTFSTRVYVERRVVANQILIEVSNAGVKVTNASKQAVREVRVRITVDNALHRSRESIMLVSGATHFFDGSLLFPPIIEIPPDTVRLTFADARGYLWEKLYLGAPRLHGQDRGWLPKRKGNGVG